MDFFDDLFMHLFINDVIIVGIILFLVAFFRFYFESKYGIIKKVDKFEEQINAMDLKVHGVITVNKELVTELKQMHMFFNKTEEGFALLDRKIGKTNELLLDFQASYLASMHNFNQNFLNENENQEKKERTALGIFIDYLDPNIHNTVLDYKKEILALENMGINIKKLTDSVDKETFVKAYVEAEPSILHFAGHSNSEGLLLIDSEGEYTIGTVRWITRVLNLSSLELVIFMSCESNDFANHLYSSQKIGCVISVDSKIPDEFAGQFSHNFYYWLGLGKSAQTAVKYASAVLPNGFADKIKIQGDFIL